MTRLLFAIPDNTTGGSREFSFRDLPTPIKFRLPLPGDGTTSGPIMSGGSALTAAGRKAVCQFWDPVKLIYDTAGCATRAPPTRLTRYLLISPTPARVALYSFRSLSVMRL